MTSDDSFLLKRLDDGSWLSSSSRDLRLQLEVELTSDEGGDDDDDVTDADSMSDVGAPSSIEVVDGRLGSAAVASSSGSS